MSEPINKTVAVVATLIGLGAVGAGLFLGGFTKEAFSAVLIEFGAAIGLVTILVLLEKRLYLRAAELVETAATDAADRATADLQERIVRLENLDEVQAQERERRREQAGRRVEDLRRGEVTPAVIGQLLADAHEERLFDGGDFRVRTSADPQSHVLYLLPLQAGDEVGVMWLDFEPFELDGQAIDVGDHSIPVPVKTETMVMWIHDQDAGEIAGQLEAALERENRPMHGFQLRHALVQLARSDQVMREARAAEAGSPSRMKGRLRLLINDDWAITSFGLEQVDGPAAFAAESGGFRGSGGASVYFGTSITIDDPPPSGSEAWDSAIKWITEREGWEVLGRGESQVHPAARLARSRRLDP